MEHLELQASSLPATTEPDIGYIGCCALAFFRLYFILITNQLHSFSEFHLYWYYRNLRLK